MFIPGIIGNQSLKHVGQIMFYQPRFVFHRRHRSGAAHDKQMDYPVTLARKATLSSVDRFTMSLFPSVSISRLKRSMLLRKGVLLSCSISRRIQQ